jgi:hypothetical protein
MEHNKIYHGTVAESLKPTFFNVATNFIVKTMKDIMFDDKTISFNFIFNEPEALTFIEKLIYEYTKNYYSGFEPQGAKIIERLKQKNEISDNLPSLIINDYKTFFEYLRRYHEKNIELFFKRTNHTGFHAYEMENAFEHIWLRATSDDFNNPEEFLKKQVEFINDETFSKYNEETVIGNVEIFDNNILCVQNEIARSWDETVQEFRAFVYDKNYYHESLIIDKKRYVLPVIRYGIYEKDGRKICSIGSIQSRKNNPKEEVISILNKKRFKVNKNISEEERVLTEPSHIISLSLFVNFLHQECITDIEFPNMYVLDYEWHGKENVKYIVDFRNKWDDKEIKENIVQYEKEHELLAKRVDDEDLVSRNKTERFTETFMRLINYYSKAEVKSYPGELDSFAYINIPVVKNKEDINNELLGELYELVENMVKTDSKSI